MLQPRLATNETVDNDCLLIPRLERELANASDLIAENVLNIEEDVLSRN